MSSAHFFKFQIFTQTLQFVILQFRDLCNFVILQISQFCAKIAILSKNPKNAKKHENAKNAHFPLKLALFSPELSIV
jgi:hypothetical protein